MVNQDLNSNSENYRHQEDDEYDEPDEGEDILHRNLEEDVCKIKRAAFESCISEIEADDDHTLIKDIWGKTQGIVRNQWFREVAIISAILILKTGLFWAYREAFRNDIEIGNL